MKKIIAAGLLSALLTTGAFADLNGSVEIKDDQGNVIWNSRTIDFDKDSMELFYNTVEQRNQLSQNEENFIEHAYDTLSESDVELLENINYFIDDYVSEKNNTKTKRVLDKLVEGLEQEVFKLVMKYPADKAMSKSDTRMYLMLNTLKLETYAKSW